MRLAEVVRVLEAEVVSPDCNLNLEVKCGGAADLMSDVLAFTKPRAVLLTGLTNPQVIRTADVAGISAIAIVRGKSIQPETLRMAREAAIPIIRTSLTMFDACGRLYEAGLRYSSESTGPPTPVNLEARR